MSLPSPAHMPPDFKVGTEARSELRKICAETGLVGISIARSSQLVAWYRASALPTAERIEVQAKIQAEVNAIKNGEPTPTEQPDNNTTDKNNEPNEADKMRTVPDSAVYITYPFDREENAHAKAQGAHFDFNRKAWYFDTPEAYGSARNRAGQGYTIMPKDGPTPTPTPTPAPTPLTGTADEQRRKLLEQLLNPAIDEARIVELIKIHAPKPEAGIYRIDLTRENGERVEIPEALRHYQFESILKRATAKTMTGQRLNVFLVGGAGVGKTTACQQVAEVLNLPFYFNGAIDSAYKLSGFINAQGQVVYTPFRKAYETGGVYLFDEMDASLPSATLAFNAALAGDIADFPDGTVKRHADFYCFAAGNTFGHGADRIFVGRNQQDGAFMDRFVKFHMTVDEKMEFLLAGNDSWVRRVQQVRRAVDKLKMRVIVSPRASYYGAAILRAGATVAEAEAETFFSGVSNEDRQKINAAVAA